MSGVDIRAQIRKCRNLLELGEQAVRHEAWDSLPRLQHSYIEAFDGLRTLLGTNQLPNQDIQEQLDELGRRQCCLVYEFKKGQRIIKARLEDLQVARSRLEGIGSENHRFYSASLDRTA